MARRRMIDPNFFESEDVSRLTLRQRFLLIGMVSMADDYGKGRATPAKVRSFVFPYEDIPIREINADMQKIAEHISIEFYEVEGNSYYKFVNWSKWQRVDKPQPSNIPDPDKNKKSYENKSKNEDKNNSENHSKNDSRNDSKNGSQIDSKNSSKIDSENHSRLKEKNIKEENIIEDLNPLTPLKGGTGSLQKVATNTETKPDWNTTLLMIFQEEFEKSRGFPYALTSYRGKEAKEINEVYRKYLQMKQSMGIIPKTDEALQDMRNFCRIAMNITDKWIYDNMSPGILSTKFTTITTMMKENRNGTHQRSNLTDADIADVVRATGLQ